MKDRSEVENLEKVIGQLQGLHSEISSLSKKSPNDAVNAFKLDLINKVIKNSNIVLGGKYLPFGDFEGFNADDFPSTSDVALVLSQYMEEAERYRSDNVVVNRGAWVYIVNGEASSIRSGPPSKVVRK